MKNFRIQIELAEDRVKTLERLMRSCDIATKKELMNNALTLLEWAVGEVVKGNIIISLNERENRYRELQMPIFFNVAKEEAAQREQREAVAAG